MRIFVAGGLGYVGSKLCPILLKHGYDVTICDLNWFSAPVPQGAHWINRDLFEITSEDLRGYDQVIFLAGFSNDPMAECRPDLNFKHNAALPAYLCYEAKRALVKRFVYASSCSVYGFAWDKIYTESDPLHCNYPYGISKYQGETGCLEQASDGFSVIALRKGTISGYSPRMRLDLVINAMTKSALHHGSIKVNNASLWRPILSINDAVSAYLRAVQAPQAISGAFNIASLNATIGSIGELVWREVGFKDVRLEIGDQPDLRNYKVSTKKAEEILGFNALDGVGDIVDELVESRDMWKDVEDPRFYNVKICSQMFAPPTR